MEKFSKTIFKFCFSLFILGIFMLFIQTADAASLYFSPSSGTYAIGKPFTISVYVSSTAQAMNAVSGKITFPKNLLQVSSLSQVESIINFWVQQPSFSNTNETIDLEGAVFDPGYRGSGGKIIDIVFSPKAQGTVNLRMASGSILANDGLGTNILEGLGSASYNITGAPITTTTTKAPEKGKIPKAPLIYSSTHPNPSEWYSETTAEFSWDLTSDITEVRLSISKSSGATPTISYAPPIKSKSVTNLGDGIWYFNVQLKNQYGWGEISRFRVQVKELGISETEEPIIAEEKTEEIKETGKISICNCMMVMILALIVSWIIIVFIMRRKYLAKIDSLEKELNKDSKEVRRALFEAFNNLRKVTLRIIANFDGYEALSKREAEINEELKKAIRDSELMIRRKLEKLQRRMKKKISDN